MVDLAPPPRRSRVAGLACAQWGPADADLTVLALPGLTSTSQNFNGLAALRPDVRLVSRGPAGPRRLGRRRRRPPGCPGTSPSSASSSTSSAWTTSCSSATRWAPSSRRSWRPTSASRVRRVVLVDGGVAPARSVRLRRPVVRTLFTVQMRLVDRRWPSAQAHLDKVEGRALAGRPDLAPAVLEWVEYSLAADGRPRLAPRRLVADAVDTLAGSPTLPALAGSDVPVHLVAATGGADDSKASFLSDEAIGLAQAAVPRLTWERSEANHLTVLFEPRLAAALDG